MVDHLASNRYQVPNDVQNKLKDQRKKKLDANKKK